MSLLFLFSLARSGSSIAAYAGAAPFNLHVADEALGPWDRTGEPYNYPPSQKQLVDLFKAENHRLTPAVVDLAQRVFAEIAGDKPHVVCKWPHLRPEPGEWRKAFPGLRAAYLIRNPLHRLNSLHRRGWTGSFGPQQDLARYTQFAKWWERQPHRLTFDLFKSDPASFFSQLWTAWGLEHNQSHIAAAISYTQGNYHASSAERSERPAGEVLSETEFALPNEAFDLYLNDPFIRPFMERMGWSTDPRDYGGAPGSRP